MTTGVLPAYVAIMSSFPSELTLLLPSQIVAARILEYAGLNSGTGKNVVENVRLNPFIVDPSPSW